MNMTLMWISFLPIVLGGMPKSPISNLMVKSSGIGGSNGGVLGRMRSDSDTTPSNLGINVIPPQSPENGPAPKNSPQTILFPPRVPFRCTLFPTSGHFCPDGYPRPSTQYYYNPYSQKCEAFYFRGCGDTPNKFSTKAACLRGCACFSDIDFGNNCPNNPFNYVIRYAFDQFSGTCQQFHFSACNGGNDNNFRSQLECQNTCGPTTDSSFPINRIPIGRLNEEITFTPPSNSIVRPQSNTPTMNVRPQGNMVSLNLQPRGNMAPLNLQPQGNMVPLNIQPQGNMASLNMQPQGNMASLSIQPQGNMAPLNLQPQGNMVPLNIQPQGNMASLNMQPQGNMASLSIQPQGNMAPLNIQPPGNMAPLIMQPQRNMAPLNIQPQGNMAPINIQQQGNMAPLNIQPPGNVAPLIMQPQGNMAPLNIQPQGNMAPLNIQQQGNMEPLNIQPQGNMAPLIMQPQGNMIPLNIQPQGNMASINVQPRDSMAPLDVQQQGNMARANMLRQDNLAPLNMAPGSQMNFGSSSIMAIEGLSPSFRKRTMKSPASEFNFGSSSITAGNSPVNGRRNRMPSPVNMLMSSIMNTARTASSETGNGMTRGVNNKVYK